MAANINGKKSINLAAAATLPERRAALRKLFDDMDKDAKARTQTPHGVRWLAFAEEIAVSLHTVQHWIRVGSVPRDKALSLELRYGHLKNKPKADDLSRAA